jgi:hypothetical protein
MSVICKPVGRGNWSPMVLEYGGPQLAPFTCSVGEQFSLGGVLWRVCEVRP